MKKLITKNKIIQKTLISVLIVLILGFTVPVRSQAGVGGMLFDPIADLVGTIFDVVIGGLQVFLVDGQMNNSDDGGILNSFLVEPEAFLKNENGKYDEFKYTGESPINNIKESELDKTILFGNTAYYIPAFRYTPDKIFANKIPALDINFINPNQWNGNTEMQERSVAIQLHETIATWYVALRNLAIVGLMLVLVYVGIRIVISSTSSDKAKYKQMLTDWLIAMCLLFCLHYIMTFTTTIVGQISEAINGAQVEQNGNNINVKVVEDDGQTPVKAGGNDVQFSTDLMGLIRFNMQSNNGWNKLLYLIFYMAMVMYTCLFTFYYLKRVINMAFLTLIAPLVALTYPIDKIKDGKAQAFDMWLKEYVFNALLQPFHLIIYTILISSSVELASKNPIFAIVALAFIMPAEKLLRKFFGFEKASTAGALGGLVGVAGGAAAMNLAKHLIPSKGGKGGSGGKGSVRTRKIPDADTPNLAETGIGNNGTNDSNKNETLEQGGPALSNSNANVNENRNTQGSQQTDSWDDNDMYLHPENYQDAFTSPTPETTSTETEQPGKQRNSFRDAFRWTENDSRGLGQWAGDSMKNIGREIRSEIFRNKNRSKCY